jgi:hypothetical protein
MIVAVPLRYVIGGCEARNGGLKHMQVWSEAVVRDGTVRAGNDGGG